MKKTEFSLVFLGVLILLCILTPNAQATPPYTAGVSAGQIATYTYSGTMSYTNPTVIHISSVSGSIVQYRRDSSTTDIPYDVSSVTSYSPWWFVSREMVAGDRFQADIVLYYVNFTVSKSMGGQTWAANQMNATVMSGSIEINALFDQDTGLMLCWEYDNHASIHVQFALQSLTTETPSTPVDASMILLMVVAGASIAAFLVSRRARTCPTTCANP